MQLSNNVLKNSYCSQALTESKKQNHTLLERVQAMQGELSDSEVRRAEVEAQLRQTHSVSLLHFFNRLHYCITSFVNNSTLCCSTSYTRQLTLRIDASSLCSFAY